VIALMVALGAAVGAPARYLTDRAVQSRRRGELPWGTWTVNVVASFVLGSLIGAAPHVSDEVLALVGTGFCGALSTFSTFSYETVRLVQRGRALLAGTYAATSLAAGIGAAGLGWWLF